MAVVSGDIVAYEDGERVVVDVTDDGFAVLRERDDLKLRDPAAKSADELTVVGHLEQLDGWVEDAPGVWRQTA